MQMKRLFEIVYILLQTDTITARVLAERFEVSQRTIYRDIEVLSMAGIPIYTNKGKGGGISLLPEFVLNKSLLTDAEQSEIISALQSLSALNMPSTEPVLDKLVTMFNKKNTNWIDVDFSHWGSDLNEKNKFDFLKQAIFLNKRVTFDYYSSYGQKSTRIVEPLKFLFKGQGWYLYGYCTLKEDYRMFKITRLKHLIVSEESFERVCPENIWEGQDTTTQVSLVTVIMKVEAHMAYRLFDEFASEDIKRHEDGSFITTMTMPETDWIYGYILSYGSSVEVLEPAYVREKLVVELQKGLNKYL